MSWIDKLRQRGFNFLPDAEQEFSDGYYYRPGRVDPATGQLVAPDNRLGWELVNRGPEDEKTPMFRRPYPKRRLPPNY